MRRFAVHFVTPSIPLKRLNNINFEHDDFF